MPEPTFHRLGVGDSFTTPARRLDDELHAELVRLGGYTHPLFVDPEHLARTPFANPPFPGQALLLVMGGLVEQTDEFDETTVALVGFDAVEFRAAVFPGDEVDVVVTVIDKATVADGRRGILTMSWDLGRRTHDAPRAAAVVATARMMFDLSRA